MSEKLRNACDEGKHEFSVCGFSMAKDGNYYWQECKTCGLAKEKKEFTPTVRAMSEDDIKKNFDKINDTDESKKRALEIIIFTYLVLSIAICFFFAPKAQCQTNTLHERYAGSFKGKPAWITYTENDQVKHKRCIRKIGELKPGLRAIRLSNVRPVSDILKLDICGASEHFDMFQQELNRAQTEFAECLGKLTQKQKEKRIKCLATDLKCSPIAQTLYNVRDYWIHWLAVAYPFSHLPARLEDYQQHLILGIYGSGGLDLYIAHRDWCENELRNLERKR